MINYLKYLLLITFSSFSFATTIHVAATGSDDTGEGTEESPFATIQKGIDTSIDADSVLVAAGTYVENINFNGKNIAVIGENRETTNIDGSGNNERVVTFENGEDTTAVLSGFSIMYGNGGIIVDESSPKLENLIIAYNQANNYGGGIYAHESQNLIITNCDIFLNFSIGAWGGGIYLSHANADMTNVVIANCGADSGSAIFINSSNLNISNCTFYDLNSNQITPPGYYLSNAKSFVWEGDNSINIMNSIITVQSMDEGYYNGYNQNSNIEISYSLLDIGSFYNFEYEGTGNVFEYSRLCLSDSTDFTLAQNSPAVGSGQNGVNMGAYGIGCDDKKIAIHVSEYGSAWGSGTEYNPFPLISQAVEKSAWSVAEDGGFISDTIIVHDGVYTELIDLPAYPDIDDYHGTWFLKSANGPSYTKIFNESIIASVYGGVIFEGFHFDSTEVEAYGANVKTNNSILTNTHWDGNSSEFHYNHCTIINNENVQPSDVSVYNSIFLNSGDNVGYMEYTLNDIGRDDNGNISGVNPIFCDQDNEDFSLAENSPGVGIAENGTDMGALGVGCEAIILAPVLTDISDQQIEEDGDLIIDINATSAIGASMNFYAESDTSDVIVSLDNSTLNATPSLNWNGTADISVMVTDENGLSDTTKFTLTVTAVNDSPEAFTVIYPTVSDTFSTHVDYYTTIPFKWQESYDVDSDVTYKLTIELEFFGNTYTDVHENITDTTISVSSNSLDALLGGLNINESILTYIVEASDEDYTIQSNAGTFFLSRASLGTINKDIVPEQFTLHQNYPNPFNPITSLRYDLPEDGLVNITIFDMGGRVVKTLINSSQTAGYKSIRWNATNNRNESVSAGLYLYTIQAGEFRQTKKMVLLK